MPRKKSNIKYIFVSGGVLSSLGKGITTSSLGLLLQAKGYRVSLVKCENYLNIDSGLINPVEHGDAFLCEDGTEADMDLGNYERFLGRNLGAHNFITMGQIYKAVIDRERNFGYAGEDVEAIPHVTDEIIARIRQAAKLDRADICIVELGGTVGEYQNALYYEASRIMRLAHADTVLNIHVSYLPTPAHIGEPKTKPTQLSIKQLNSMGIHPDFLIVRGERPLDSKRRERLALFSNLHPEDIINNPDVDSIYEIPLILHEQELDKKILAKIGLKNTRSNLTAWKRFLKKVKASPQHQITISIVGKYFRTGDYNLADSYASLIEALKHAAIHQNIDLKLNFINSALVEKKGAKILAGSDGIIVPIGWGARGTKGKIQAIEYARVNKIPYLGLCYGLQLAAVEYARNVLNLKGANSTEIDSDTKDPIIHIIPEQLRNVKKRAYGGTMRLGAWDAELTPGTLAHKIYAKHNRFTDRKKGLVSERHRHRYEFNNKYREALEAKGLVFSGWSPDEGLAEYLELPSDIHPFFLATQAHPEYKSRPLDPHPIFFEFLKASVDNQ